MHATPLSAYPAFHSSPIYLSFLFLLSLSAPFSHTRHKYHPSAHLHSAPPVLLFHYRPRVGVARYPQNKDINTPAIYICRWRARLKRLTFIFNVPCSPRGLVRTRACGMGFSGRHTSPLLSPILHPPCVLEWGWLGFIISGKGVWRLQRLCAAGCRR